MTFVFDGKHTVVDAEKGMTIQPKYWVGDRPSRTMRFTFSQKEFSFDFQAAFVNKHLFFWNKTTGKDTESFAPHKTYIMEDWFSAELMRNRLIAKLPKLSPSEYEQFRENIRQGMAELTTKGGTISSTDDFSVEFIPNEKVYDEIDPVPARK